MSAEDPSHVGPLFAVPTADLSVYQHQLDKFRNHATVDKSKGERHGRTPFVRDLLHSGRNISDYVITSGGPTAYEGSDGWGRIWTLLDQFLGVAPFAFPEGVHREPSEFRVTIQQLHERWWEEESSTVTNADPSGGGDA
jgi:hypothetical protein